MKFKSTRLLSILLLLTLLFSSCQIADEPIATDVLTDASTEAVTDAPTDEPTDAPTDEPTEEATEPEQSEGLVIPAEPEKPASDPYANVSAQEFYLDYEPAESYWDAYYRTQHGFMSGSIEAQDQKPTLAEDRPMLDGLYLRNTSALYSKDGNVYYVVDADGYIVNKIYKGAAYVTLEEVAAYVFAFGDVPANYVSGKNAKPADSKWGVYLRLNHSSFSGSTTKYPYEPELPDISGCGGSLRYYEIDIGTTGTDCDPAYRPAIYNNGSKITRGAARIVYSRFDANGDSIIDVNEKYLFYTYNHYNDFQEYLNYEGGWGEMFGNITGGGKISSKTDCNPTPYVAVARRAFVEKFEYESTVILVDIYYLDYLSKRACALAA
jgi:hypothetical protein